MFKCRVSFNRRDSRRSRPLHFSYWIDSQCLQRLYLQFWLPTWCYYALNHSWLSYSGITNSVNFIVQFQGNYFINVYLDPLVYENPSNYNFTVTESLGNKEILILNIIDPSTLFLGTSNQFSKSFSSTDLSGIQFCLVDSLSTSMEGISPVQY